jgi:hypothetical protein
MIMVADFTGELRLELQLPRSAAKRTMFLITEFIRNIKLKGETQKNSRIFSNILLWQMKVGNYLVAPELAPRRVGSSHHDIPIGITHKCTFTRHISKQTLLLFA